MHARVMMINTTALIIASLWRRKRRQARREGLLGLVARPCASADRGSTGPVVPGGTVSVPMTSRSTSVKANPRVKPRVREVGEQVENDDERNDHHHPRQDRRVVAIGERIEEVRAHARILE